MGKGVLGIQEHKLDMVMPTYSHLALVRLMEHGYLKFVVTSNHDDIHSRSGMFYFSESLLDVVLRFLY